MFTPTGGDVEGSLQIDAWIDNMPNFGIGNPTATQDFWENWWNQGIEGGLGNTARTTRIFIDRAPCYSGYNLSVNTGFNQSMAWELISPGNVSEGAWVNSWLTEYNTTQYWEAGYEQDSTANITNNVLQYFGSGSTPLNSDDDGDQNWNPAGFSYGSCTNGEYGQITFSSIGPGVGSSFAPGSDTEFKNLMQTPNTIFKFANDPTDTFYKVKRISNVNVEETQPYFYTEMLFHVDTAPGLQSPLTDEEIDLSTSIQPKITNDGIARTMSEWSAEFGPSSPSPVEGYTSRINAYWANALPSSQPGVVIAIGVNPPSGSSNMEYIRIRRVVMVNVDPIEQDTLSVWNAKNYSWTNSEDPLLKRHSIIVRFDKLDSNGGIISNSGIDITQWDPRGEVRHDGIGSMAIQIMQPLDGGELSNDTVAPASACW